MSEKPEAPPVMYRVTAVAAERLLQFVPTSGPSLQITVRLGVPRRDRKHVNGDWVCPYDITGFQSPRRRWSFGIDSVQALTLALHIIPAELGRLAKLAGGGQFTFLGEQGISFADGCGLLLNGLVDQAVGRAGVAPSARSVVRSGFSILGTPQNKELHLTRSAMVTDWRGPRR